MKIAYCNHLKKATLILTSCIFTAAAEPICAAQSPAVELSGSQGGRIASATLKSRWRKMYLSGIVQRHIPSHMGVGSHVEVDLLDSHGRLVEKLTDRLSPSSPRRSAFRDRHSYVVSWPIGLNQRVSNIRVRYVPYSHYRCTEGGGA